MTIPATAQLSLFLRPLLALGALSGLAYSSVLVGCSGDNSVSGDGDASGGTTAATGGNSPGSGGETNATGGNGSGGEATTGGSGPGLPPTSYNCEPAVGDVPALGLDVVVDGLNTPVFVTHAPNDPRLFVVELGGIIRVVENGTLAAEPLLDITSLVRTSQNEGERGLLGLAFHPNFATNGLLYVHFSASQAGTQFPNGTTVLAEFGMQAGSTSVANPDSGRILLNVPQPDVNHNGGTVTFGPDGMLYLGLGDGGGKGDPQLNGQNEKSLLGTICALIPTVAMLAMVPTEFLPETSARFSPAQHRKSSVMGFAIRTASTSTLAQTTSTSEM